MKRICNHTDIVFYENAAGQEVDNEFQGPGACCNVLTESWFWRETDSNMILKSADWVIDKIKAANQQNVAFILNGAPNQKGLLDNNVVECFNELGSAYKKPADLIVLPLKWKYRD